MTRRALIFTPAAALLTALLLTLPHRIPTSTIAAAASPPASQPATAPAAPTPIRVNPAIADSPKLLTSATPLFTVTKIIEPSSDKLLADTLAAVKKSGDALHSIHVEGSYNQEACDPLHHLWIEEASVEGDGVYEIQSRRQRYHVSSYLADWNPTRKSIFEQFDEASDGTNFQQIPKRYFIGAYSGPPIPNPQPAQDIVGYPFAFPFELATERAADKLHTAYYPLYSRIDPATASARRIILNDSQPATELLFHYQSDPYKVTETWYLDPDHGLALIAALQNREYNHNINWSQCIVYSLLPAAPGIFFPQHAAQISGYNQFPHARGVFTACSAIANESHPDSFFTLTKPLLP
ncbi:MAG TPA: hypothetical protein VHQ47_18520 [Phycisphaerae bacterium]|nr:hypothetical protein [Phycisphaerae bacterium]